ncbi:MAG: IS1634 family transposase, partial [Planctomycetes bacterium]|nr:IS1634 family transposase [Planctomycetota bacterium]
MFFRTKGTVRKYLQIVHNRRENGKVKQSVLVTLGRLDKLKSTGALDSLLRSGIRYSEKLAVLDASKRSKTDSGKDKKIGIPMIFDRLWRLVGIKTVVDDMLLDRRHKFSLERAIFVTVLHRIVVSGSDRSADDWYRDYKIEGMETIELQHLYRSMGWLGERLEDEEQGGATPFAPRCTKDLIEEELYKRRRDLFTNLSMVFFDTTSIYFEGEGGDEIGRRGKSKDHRPDLKQMVVGIILDQEGTPLCCEMWPGNTADVKTLRPLVKRLKSKFGIGKICIVADRGMISRDTIKRLEDEEEMDYILGVRMRKQKEVKEEVLSRAGRYKEIRGKRQNSKSPSPLKVKEVLENGKRYIVCYNEDQSKKDKADRDAIRASLEEKLNQGDKSVVGNKGYKKYLKGGGFEIDEDKIKEEAKYDGKWVVTTNTKLTAEQVALQYKQLWMVEAVFKTLKSILHTRPIYHKCDETIRGHVFCSFLSLVLMKELQNKMEEKWWICDWRYLINHLDSLKETEIETP